MNTMLNTFTITMLNKPVVRNNNYEKRDKIGQKRAIKRK